MFELRILSAASTRACSSNVRSSVANFIVSSLRADEFTIYSCNRHEHIPTLHIRQAIVEDTDDLTPIFSKLDTLLTEVINFVVPKMSCLRFLVMFSTTLSNRPGICPSWVALP